MFNTALTRRQREQKVQCLGGQDWEELLPAERLPGTGMSRRGHTQGMSMAAERA